MMDFFLIFTVCSVVLFSFVCTWFVFDRWWRSSKIDQSASCMSERLPDFFGTTRLSGKVHWTNGYDVERVRHLFSECGEVDIVAHESDFHRKEIEEFIRYFCGEGYHVGEYPIRRGTAGTLRVECLRDRSVRRLIVCFDIFDEHSNQIDTSKLVEWILDTRNKNPRGDVLFVNTNSNAEIPKRIRSLIDYFYVRAGPDDWLIAHARNHLHDKTDVSLMVKHINSLRISDRLWYLVVDLNDGTMYIS
jgi:hypothetical protein